MISGEWYGVQGRPVRLIPGVLFFFAYTLDPGPPAEVRPDVRGPRAASGRTGRSGPRRSCFGALFQRASFVAALLAPVDRNLPPERLFQHLPPLLLSSLCIAVGRRALPGLPGGALARAAGPRSSWVLYGLVARARPVHRSSTRCPGRPGLAPPLGEEAASAFFVLLPLAMAVAILKHRLLDIEVIINRSRRLFAPDHGHRRRLPALDRGAQDALRRPARSGPRAGSRSASAFIAAMAFAPGPVPDPGHSSTGPSSGGATTTARPSSASRRRPERPDSATDLLALFDRTRSTRRCPAEKVGALRPGAGRRAARDRPEARARRRGRSRPSCPPPGGREEPLDGRRGRRPAASRPSCPCRWATAGPCRLGLRRSEEVGPARSRTRTASCLETLAAELAAALRRVRLQEEVIYERASREKLGGARPAEDRVHLLGVPRAADAHDLAPVDLRAAQVGQGGRRVAARPAPRAHGRRVRPARPLPPQRPRLRPHRAGRQALRHPGDRPRTGRRRRRRGRRGRRRPGEDLELEVAAARRAGPGRGRPRRGPPGPAQPRGQRHQVQRGAEARRRSARARPPAAPRSASATTGIGIAPEDRQRIFEAFYRSPAAVRHDPKGVGLGLKIVKHIMDAHGGTHRRRGRPGARTTVTLKFPRRRNP
ncbi:MAG: ATP-binding protein [Sphingobacterium sp.]|nr:ATP-binding protein [Sphingobacterium sp.]